MMNSPLIFPGRVIAHRGASAYAPENTLAAFKKAQELNITWVEFDVMQSLCGEVIIFHDELLDRTTNGKGDVSLVNYSDLTKLDAGSWFTPDFSAECIPTLNQLLEFLTENNMSMNIELKSLPGDEEKLVLKVLEVVSQYQDNSSAILFSSFSLQALQALHHYSPESNKGMLLHEWEENWEKLCVELNCVSVHVFEEILTKQTSHEIKAMNKKLLSYTVNDPNRAAELFSWGVDAVFSDRPDVIKNLEVQ